ncbi:MAG TPA: TOBE domain-containing protein [Ottowia sp.]|nr:TOBE domain-containing protein [Ottowia sp.]
MRPHQVSIADPQQAGDAARLWLDGQVESAEFLGEFSRYRVRVGELALLSDQPHYAGVPLFPAGAPVRLGIDPRQLRVLTS